MKPNRYIWFFLITFFCIVSCTKDDDPFPQPEETKHTLLIYMPWSSNLTFDFEQNIADFEAAIRQNILQSHSRVIVFFMPSATEATLFELKYKNGNCTREVIKKYADPAFTTATGITSIWNDVAGYAPAYRYSMVIGAHSMGWVPVSSFNVKTMDITNKNHWEYENALRTRFFGGLESEYQTDITTLAKGISDAGLKMEYILFDDCYMSSIEVAYDLKDVTRYLIACPTEIMAYGYPYAEIARYLVDNIDYSGISRGFISFYENYLNMPCGTIGITDCSEVEKLASIMKEVNNRYKLDQALLNDIQSMCGYSPVIFFDLGDYVEKLCPDTHLLSTFKAQLDLTVPPAYRKHTRTYYSAGRGEVPIKTYTGITISDPSKNGKAIAKTETAWYKATH